MKEATKRPSLSPSDRGLAKLGNILPQLIVQHGLQRRRNAEDINDAWKKAVGPPFDAVTNVVGLNRGTLEVSVPHPAFVQELSFRQAELLRTMQAALPNEKVRKIKFQV